MKKIFLYLVFTFKMLYLEVLEGVILTPALSKRGKTLAEFLLQSVCHVAGKLTQSYDFTLPSTWNFIVFSFVALLRNKDKLTISYSLGSSLTVKRDVAGWRRLLLLTGRLTLLLQWQKQVKIKSRERFDVVYFSTTTTQTEKKAG